MLPVMPGTCRAQPIECAAIDVADVHARAGLVERPRDRGADAAGAGRDQDAQIPDRAKRIEDGHERPSLAGLRAKPNVIRAHPQARSDVEEQGPS